MNTDTLMENLLEYLKKMSTVIVRNEFKYNNFEDFVFKNGVPFKEMSSDKVRMGQQGNCFMNAARLSQNRKYTYCEGYCAVSDVPIPILHAWVIDEQHKVVENTLRISNNAIAVYYGVVFSGLYLATTISQRRYFGLIDNMEMKYPLITGEHTDFKDEKFYEEYLNGGSR